MTKRIVAVCCLSLLLLMASALLLASTPAALAWDKDDYARYRLNDAHEQYFYRAQDDYEKDNARRDMDYWRGEVRRNERQARQQEIDQNNSYDQYGNPKGGQGW